MSLSVRRDRHRVRSLLQVMTPWVCAILLVCAPGGSARGQADGAAAGEESAIVPTAAQEEETGGGLFYSRKGEPLTNLIERLTLSGSVRLRPEFSRNFTDFDSDLDDSFDFVTARFRLALGVDVIHNISFLVEGQNNSFWGDFSTSGNFDPTGEDNFSLYQGYIQVRDIAGSKFGVRAGRQELVYGTELLLGDADFGPGISHDAVKLTYDTDRFSVHAWWSRLVEGNLGVFTTPQPTGDEDADFFGLYSMLKLANGSGVDAYWLFLRDGVSPATTGLPQEQIHTLGLRGYHALTDFISLNGEFAYQFGDSISVLTGPPFAAGPKRTIHAVAFETDVTLHCKDVAMEPMLKVGYAFATGDADPTDGDSDTFRPLFQDNHPRLGLSDFLFLQNLHALTATATVQPHKNVGVGGAFNSYWAHRTEDATGLPPPTTGTVTTDNHFLGHEINLFVNLVYTEFLSAQFAWAHFIPGEYIGDHKGAMSDADRIYFHLVFAF